MWWNIAASQGDEDAQKKLDIITKDMSPAQLKTAKRLAKECIQKNYKGC